MQLYARESKDNLIYAGRAFKHIDYACIECSQPVRLRSGTHRQAHFYHLRPNASCNQHGKSMTHLMLQCHLKKLLPPNEADLEYRFTSIGRIADVAWHKQKLIFEVQCSPISPEEIAARNQDYASLGFRVIWILHDNRFNQWRISAAEYALAEWIHFYTDMNSEGRGLIYEQLYVAYNGIRKERAPKLPINVSVIQSTPDISATHFEKALPKIALKKIYASPLHFEGDTVYHCIKYFTQDSSLTEYLKSLSEMESRWESALIPKSLSSMSLGSFIKLVWRRLIVEPYSAVLRLLLERACR